MLNIHDEEIISFTEATRRLPRRRKDKRPHVATIYRWAQRGCRGVFLETIQVGGTRCTSVEALQRFFDRLSRGTSSDRVNTPAGGKRALAKIDQQLDEAGL